MAIRKSKQISNLMKKMLGISKKDDKDFTMMYLNTMTSLDIVTGSFRKGIPENKVFPDYQSYLHGGVSSTFAVTGRPQSYKSTLVLSLLSRILRIYPDSCAFVYDSEMAISGKRRIVEVGTELDSFLNSDEDEIADRIELRDRQDFSIEGLFETIKNIGEERSKHIKDLIVETPFIDRDGKRIKTIIPFILVIDSLSKLSSSEELELYDKHQITDKETNMVFMRDGLNKTKFIGMVPLICKNNGIHFIMTAHLGKKSQISPFEPMIKELQFMGMSESVKNVGSQFNFLINTLIKSNRVTCLQDSKKEVLFPPSFKVPSLELNQCDLMMCRCKNNISGSNFSPIISQNFGILEGISNYKLLKENKLYGMDGNSRNQRIRLLEKYALSRTKVRTLISDNYELFRALEILSQMFFLYSYWPLNKPQMKILNEKSVDEISDMLVKNKKILISDILNSRGYWTYGKDDRKYLGILDILQLLNNE